MKTIAQNIYAKLGRIIFFVVFFSLVPILLEYYFVYFSKTDDWFVYTSLKVLEHPGVHVGTDNIEVFSYAVIKRPVQITWVDSLWCKKNGGFEFVESHISERYFEKPTVLPRTTIDEYSGLAIEIPWRFGVEETLSVGETCYVESGVTASLPYGITRSQVITSNIFTIN